MAELEIPATARAALKETTNASYWNFLSQYTTKSARSYTPDTFLLTTQWGQGLPYNTFMPTVDGDLTKTGCVQTAVAQLMNYHEHPATGSGVFTHTWNSQTLTAVMNRPYNWSVMPDIASGSTPQYAQEEVAALMRDLGILNQANFGVSETSASFYTSEFSRAFGYAPTSYMAISDESFFSTITSEIDALRPVILIIPGHMTVADGYASDGSGKKIHVNLGWGGAYDDYYYLDQTNVIGSYSFAPDNAIVYNLQPCIDDECQPYTPTGGNNPPVFGQSLDDQILDSTTTIRIDAYDPDGDNVTLSTSSSCSAVVPTLSSNFLTLTPNTTNSFCRISVNAQSQDGATTSTFQVLTLDSMIYMGTEYDINGQFADQNEVDSHTAYFDGATTISGYRGYSNQAFFTWVTNQNGDTVVTATDNALSSTFSAGLYTVKASLKNPASGSYYPYSESYSSYILSVDAGALSYTVSDLAASLGVCTTDYTVTVSKAGSGDGTVNSSPASLDCGETCTVDLTCGTELTLTAVPDGASMLSQWSGDCAGIEQSVALTLTEEKDCTATFETDADQDQMPDTWEEANGLDTTTNDADQDTDGDGVSNRDEYLQGTHPNPSPSSTAMPWLPLLLSD